jgi:hypothetical protein
MRKFLISICAAAALIASCTTADKKQTLSKCVQYQDRVADASCSDQDKKEALSWYKAEKHAAHTRSH